VSDEVVAELAVREGPDLHETVPSAGNDERDRLGRRESDTGHPLGVAFGVGADSVLALSEGVPELDGLVTGSGHDLTIVDAEGNGQDILGVTHESAGRTAGVDLPKAEGSIPGSREGELTVRRDHDVGDEVRVAAEGALGITVGIVITRGMGKAPDEDGFVAGSGEDEVGVLGCGGDRGDPIGMATEGTSETESFGHGYSVWLFV